ncbi:MAG: hypothetical protein KIT89_02565 [Microcella sp.]|uniref:hypothetical protein n=1 Tax=Microcella sp. TaxID=1913979 RepID=UPI0024C89AAA|nr:hypothetical protein [Microcella sp.]UYN84118.1 MAG: hypothetical protein KIT89_02565 [Microcella sp.]
MAWVRVNDVVLGQAVLSLDGDQVAMFTANAYDTYRLHLALAIVEVSGPDQHHRYKAVISTQGGGRGPAIAVTVEAHEWPALSAWVDAVRAAQSTLAAPLA